MTTFVASYQSEWLKTKRSLAAWLVVLGGFFIPFILFWARVLYPEKLKKAVLAPTYWEEVLSQSWQFMAILMLPMGLVLATSLLTQMEFRNNTWKQLHTTPQSYTTIFVAKLGVLLTMLVQFFILFNLGMYLSGILPPLVFGISLPKQAFPWEMYLKTSGHFWINCLPIVGFQYLVSLQFKNFLVPLGAGIGLLLASLIGIEWEHGHWLPYSYCSYYFFSLRGAKMGTLSVDAFSKWALGYFVGFTLLSYFFYILKKDKS